MSMRARIPAALAGLVTYAFSAAAIAAPPAHLDVDTSAVGDAGPVVKRRLEERGATVLRELGVPGDTNASGNALRLTVREFGGDAPGFELTAVLVRSGTEVEGTRAVVVCSLCTEGELVDRAEAELRKLVSALEELPEEDPAGTETVPAGPNPEGDGSPALGTPPEDERDGPPLGTLGWTGVGLLAGGGAALIGGAVLAALPPQPLDSDPTQERYTSTAGFVTLGLGVAAAAAGGALLGIDRRRARVSASASPNHAAVSFRLSF